MRPLVTPQGAPVEVDQVADLDLVHAAAAVMPTGRNGRGEHPSEVKTAVLEDQLLAAEARLAIAQAWIDGNRADRDIAARQRDQLARALARLDTEDPLALDFEVSVGAALKDAFAALRPERAAVEARELGTTAVIRYLSTSEDTRVTLLAILLEQRRGDWEVTAYSNSVLQPEPIEPHWPRTRHGRW